MCVKVLKFKYLETGVLGHLWLHSSGQSGLQEALPEQKKMILSKCNNMVLENRLKTSELHASKSCLQKGLGSIRMDQNMMESLLMREG